MKANLDLWEFVLHVIRVHRLDLFTSGSTENLDDLNELIDTVRGGLRSISEVRKAIRIFSTHPDSPGKRGCPSISSAMTHPADQTSIHGNGKERKKCQNSFHKRRVNARRLTDVCGVVGSAEDQFRCPVVPRTDVRNVWFALDQDLRTSEIAKFEDTRRRVEQQILRLDISVTDPY